MNWKKIIIFSALIILILFIALRCYLGYWTRQHLFPAPDTDSVNRIKEKITEEMTISNKSVLIYQDTSVIYVGEYKMYAIGIKNVDEHELKYHLKLTQISSPSEETKNADKWFIFQSSEFSIKPNDLVIKGIGVSTPANAKTGNYKFLFEVIQNSTNGIYGQQEVDVQAKNKPMWQKLKEKFNGVC